MKNFVTDQWLLRLAGTAIALAEFTSCAQVSESSLSGPTQAAIGPDGHLYVADGYYNSRIAVFDAAGNFVREFGRPGFGRGEFHTPHGLSIGTNGLLYVADRGNARVQVFSYAGNYLSEFNSAILGHIFSVAVTASGRIFAADGGKQQDTPNQAGISEIDAGGIVLQKIGTLGTAPGDFDEPHMLTAADDNTLYVSEIGNHRVQKLTRIACAMSLCPFTYDATWPATETRSAITEPLSIAMAPAGKVWIGFTNGLPGIALVSATTGAIEKIIRHPNLRRPHGISTDGNGTTWIADNETNCIFRILNNQAIEQVVGK